MNQGKFVELTGGPATCRVHGAADRSVAQRVLVGRQQVSDVSLPDVRAVDAPGRVVSLGRFREPVVGEALKAALPDLLRRALRDDFEWYACRGAFFHTDAHFADVLFGAWCVAGPRREIVFARGGRRIPAGPGDWAVFDPFEPHGVLDEGADRYRREAYLGAPASLFVGFELVLDAVVRAAFGIGPPEATARLLASGVSINAENGALP